MRCHFHTVRALEVSNQDLSRESSQPELALASVPVLGRFRDFLSARWGIVILAGSLLTPEDRQRTHDLCASLACTA